MASSSGQASDRKGKQPALGPPAPREPMYMTNPQLFPPPIPIGKELDTVKAPPEENITIQQFAKMMNLLSLTTLRQASIASHTAGWLIKQALDELRDPELTKKRQYDVWDTVVATLIQNARLVAMPQPDDKDEKLYKNLGGPKAPGELGMKDLFVFGNPDKVLDIGDQLCRQVYRRVSSMTIEPHGAYVDDYQRCLFMEYIEMLCTGVRSAHTRLAFLDLVNQGEVQPSKLKRVQSVGRLARLRDRITGKT